MTTTYVGIVVRVTTLAVALALVLSDYVVRPLAASGVAALVSVAASVLAVLWPRSAATTVSLLGLAAAFLVSSRNTHGAALVTWIVVEATALWLVHQGYALAAAVPARAVVAADLLAEFVRRTVAVLVIAGPVTAVAVLAAAAAPTAGILRVAGVVTAVVAGLLPVVLTRRTRG